MRKQFLTVIGILVCVFAACSAPPASTPKPTAPLFDNPGTYHVPITTASPEAQKYFDQGFTLAYAFNHAEAIRATTAGRFQVWRRASNSGGVPGKPQRSRRV